MGNVEHLLEFHRDELLDVIEDCTERAWNSNNPQLRAAVLSAIGSVSGFDPKPNRSWSSVASGLTIGIRRLREPRLSKLARLAVLLGDPDRNAAFLKLVSGEHAHTASAEPIHGETPQEDREISGQAWRDAVAHIEPNLHRHYLLFAAVTADNPESSLQRGAADGFSELYQRCLPNAAADADEPETSTQAAESELADEHETSKDEIPTVRHRSQTDLDRAFIDIIVQAADGQDGARSPTEVEGIIDEFCRLNSKRFQSRFLLGFHAALTNGALPERAGAENDARRAWRIAGWIMGHIRREAGAAYARYEALPKHDRAALMSEPAALPAIATRFIEALIAGGRPAQIIEWIAHAPATSWPAVLEYAGSLTRSGRPGDAVNLAEALGQCAVDKIQSERQPAFNVFVVDAALAIAAAKRALGRFDQAVEWVDRAEGACTSLEKTIAETSLPMDDALSSFRGRVATERVLCAAGVRNVDALWFADERSWRGNKQLLDQASQAFRNILTATTTPSTEVAFCVGLWAFLQSPSAARAAGANTCIAWLAELGSRPSAAHREHELTPLTTRLWVLRALLLAREGGPSLTGCIDDIAAFEATEGALPFIVVRDAIESGLAEDAVSVDQLIVPRIATELQQMAKSGLLSAAVRNARVLARLRADLPEVVKALPRSDALTSMIALFEALAEGGGRAPDLRAIGDEILAVVHDYADGAPEAIRAFRFASRGASIWGEDDYCAIEFELALNCKDDIRSDARARLVRRASVLVSAMRHDEAEECLELAERLGEPRESTEGLRARITKVRSTDGPAGGLLDAPKRRVRVLFVGGDERQRREQDMIRKLVASQRRNVEIEFEHPGWGSNWAPKLATAIRKLDQADIVVLLRFTRTIYGEKLRDAIGAAGKQWRPTYGHGAPAIARAIAQAASEFAP